MQSDSASLNIAATPPETPDPFEPASPPGPAPVTAAERVEIIDIIRGFALFGILLVNMAYFSGPFTVEMLDPPRWPGALDQFVRRMIRFLAETKFYSLFSFLFGVGMAVQMGRAEQRGARFGWLYARRLFVLLLFGVAHATLLWAGDILTAYALIGFVLLLFRKRADKTLLVWAVIGFLIPVLLVGALTTMTELGKANPQTAEGTRQALEEQQREGAKLARTALQTYAHGSFREILAVRLVEWQVSGVGLLFISTNILALFLLGLWAGRWRILQNATAHLPWIRRVAVWGLLFGILGNLGYTIGMEAAEQEVLSVRGWLAFCCDMFGAPALCFFYAASLIRLWHRPRGAVWLRPLAAVGRMALSNYLLQSLVCTTLFYSYGFGLYGKVGPALGVVITVLIYLAQIPLSNWWLRRFQFGPAEWLWRSLTYLRRQPFRL